MVLSRRSVVSTFLLNSADRDVKDVTELGTFRRRCRRLSASASSFAKLRPTVLRAIIRSSSGKSGFDTFEGHRWRGLHHPATMWIAAYGFLISERETILPSRPHRTTLFQTLCHARPLSTEGIPPLRPERHIATSVAPHKRLRQLEDENAKLKKLLAEQMLDGMHTAKTA